jgi:hypothetical protein
MHLSINKRDSSQKVVPEQTGLSNPVQPPPTGMEAEAQGICPSSSQLLSFFQKQLVHHICTMPPKGLLTVSPTTVLRHKVFAHLLTQHYLFNDIPFYFLNKGKSDTCQINTFTFVPY